MAEEDGKLDILTSVLMLLTSFFTVITLNKITKRKHPVWRRSMVGSEQMIVAFSTLVVVLRG